MYNIDQNDYLLLDIKLPQPIYNSISFFVEENLLVILGGENSDNENGINSVLRINLDNKIIVPLEELPIKASFIMPYYYLYDSVHLFPIKQNDILQLPDHIEYKLDLPGLDLLY